MNNLDLMLKRLNYQGGNQEGRMIKDKYHSFLQTLKCSYQGCDISLIQKYNNCTIFNNSDTVRSLINPDKTKQNYDDKILSVDYKYGFEPGDIFNWKNTDTNWIIYLQFLTEDAYFRGEIRRCKYKIKFKNSAGEVKETWAAIRGPVETTIDSIQKNQLRINNPNLSLNILLPLNEDTKEMFIRYSEFIFDNMLWRVETFDRISIKNVIEISAQEYYYNKEVDSLENKLADGLIIEKVDPSPNTKIKGETFIKPQIKEIYTAPASGGVWKSNSKFVCITDKGIEAEIVWNKTTSGSFDLYWEKDGMIETKTIVVESLF